MKAPDHRALIGRVLGGKFRLRRYIGAGSSGTVYEADQTALGRTVAVKILNQHLAGDSRLTGRFQDEARAASRLNHPNTVSVIDYGQTPDGLLYLVMEYLRGVTLSEVLANDAPLASERIVDFVSQILCGLEEAHDAGVVHADVKSDNIVVEHRRGDWFLVKVVDFGIARLLGTPSRPRDEEEARAICGTPEYMAPEIIGGQDPTFASDLYAVGIILYELLAGETPFAGGPPVEVLTRHLREEPVLPSIRRPELAIDRRLEQVAMRALAKHPTARFGSATEFRAALEAALEQRMPQQEDNLLCGACGVYAAASFKFCPECGNPRVLGAHGARLDTVPGIVSDESTQPLGRDPAAHPANWADEDIAGSIFPLPLAGRHDALDALTSFVSGQGGVIMQLCGPPGSGRSRLLEALQALLAGRSDMSVYRAGADPSGLAAPFHPIRTIVTALLTLPAMCAYDTLSAGLELLGLSRRDLPGIAELFGHHGELWQLEPAVRRRELMASALRVLKAAAPGHGKAVFLLDDVDRYDQPSRDLLFRLAEIADSGVDLPLRVIVTHGPALASHWPGSVARLDLAPLTEDDFAGLAVHIEQVGHGTMPSARELAALTGGSPNHLQHLVRFIVEGGSIEAAPRHLADLVAERITSLPHEARVLCQTAAVFGDEIARETMRHTLGRRMDNFAFDTALALVEARGLLFESGDRSTVGFTHALVRDVVYDATPANVRRELHADAVRVLAATVSDALALGHHHERAGNLVEAATALMRAGDDAVRMLDDAGAIELYQRALTAARRLMLSDDDSASRIRFVTLSVKLADALRVSGETALARGIVEEAKSHSQGTPDLEAQLLQASAHLFSCESNFGAAIDSLRRGIGLLIPVGEMELLAELYLDLSSMYLRKGETEKALAELGEGLDIITLGEGADAANGPAILWRLLQRMAQIHCAAERVPTAVHLAERALVHARRIRSRIGSARVQALLASLYEQVGDVRLAEKYRQAAVNEMRRLGDRRGTAELLLAGVVPTRTLLRINPATLREARALADEVGWIEGVEEASQKTRQIKDL